MRSWFMRPPPRLDSLSYSDAVCTFECFEIFNLAALVKEGLEVCDILNLNISTRVEY